jgi:hypothetical protein
MELKRHLSVLLCCCLLGSPAFGQNWYKGSLHTHSLWSDGDDYPEMIMDWYKANGYHFVGLSDHNTLQEGEKWINVPRAEVRRRVFERYLRNFGPQWVQYRSLGGDTLQVRLKTLEEYRGLFEAPASSSSCAVKRSRVLSLGNKSTSTSPIYNSSSRR